MRKASPSLLVIIVNFRTPELVVALLHSLEPEVRDYSSASVVVVDNASGGHSLDCISTAIKAEGWESWASLLPAPRNGGFAYGNNLAIKEALKWPNPPKFFWLLNPDTLVRKGATRALAEFMEANRNVAICGGGIEDSAGKPWMYTFRFPGILSEVERGFRFSIVTRPLSRWVVCQPVEAKPTPAEWVSGCTLIIRRETIEKIGMLDEDYFLYYEETDYCLRARRAGLECWYFPNGKIMHIAGQSTGVTGKTQGINRIPAYWFQSRRRYFAKNYGRLYAIITDLAWVLSYCLGSLRLSIQRKHRRSPPKLLADFIRHSALWHSIKNRSKKHLHSSTAERSSDNTQTR